MEKKCNNCGFSNNPDNANFCGKCGNKFSVFDKIADWCNDNPCIFLGISMFIIFVILICILLFRVFILKVDMSSADIKSEIFFYIFISIFSYLFTLISQNW